VSDIIRELARVLDEAGLDVTFDRLRDGSRCAYCDAIAVPWHADHHQFPVPGLDPLECRKACSREHADLASKAWARRQTLVPAPASWREDPEDGASLAGWLGAWMVVRELRAPDAKTRGWFEASVESDRDLVRAARRSLEEARAAAEWFASANARARLEARAAAARDDLLAELRLERDLGRARSARSTMATQRGHVNVLRRELAELARLLALPCLGGPHPKSVALLVPAPEAGLWYGLRPDEHDGAPVALGGRALPGESHASCAVRAYASFCVREPADLRPLEREVVDGYDCALFACDGPPAGLCLGRFADDGVAEFTRHELLDGPHGEVYQRAFAAYDALQKAGAR
jgi:hypothetical protein